MRNFVFCILSLVWSWNKNRVCTSNKETSLRIKNELMFGSIWILRCGINTNWSLHVVWKCVQGKQLLNWCWGFQHITKMNSFEHKKKSIRFFCFKSSVEKNKTSKEGMKRILWYAIIWVIKRERKRKRKRKRESGYASQRIPCPLFSSIVFFSMDFILPSSLNAIPWSLFFRITFSFISTIPKYVYKYKYQLENEVRKFSSTRNRKVLYHYCKCEFLPNCLLFDCDKCLQIHSSRRFLIHNKINSSPNIKYMRLWNNSFDFFHQMWIEL
jgi:hypothetical protein